MLGNDFLGGCTSRSAAILRQKILRVMDPLSEGYLWSTACSAEYILGNYEDPLTVKTFFPG